jgi:DNA-binding CsgD family transcriptional regulator
MLLHIYYLENELVRLRAIVSRREETIALVDKLNRFQDILFEITNECNVISSRLLNLTPAEKRVYAILRRDRRIILRQIAQQLGLTKRCVQYHVEQIMFKAKVRNRYEI